MYQNIGVKQGENLSLFLFSLLSNDLESYFVDNGVHSLYSILHMCQGTLDMYIKLFLILYAEDTTLMAESPDGLHYALDYFKTCCDIWKLRVNTNKTKVVVFSQRTKILILRCMAKILKH